MRALLSLALLLLLPSIASAQSTLPENIKQEARDVCSAEIDHAERAVYRFDRFGVYEKGVTLCGSVTVAHWKRSFVWARSEVGELCIVNDAPDALLATMCDGIVPNP
jgi:hypothetical protein